MRKPIYLLAVLGTFAIGALHSPAFAADDDKSHPPGHAKKEAAKDKADDKKEAAKDKADEKKEAAKDKADEKKEAAKDKADDKKEAAKDKAEEDADLKTLKDEWKKKRAAWVEKRQERREAARAELKKKYGDQISVPAMREELRKHARRVARLERIAFLAEATSKPKVLERAKELLKKENERHEKRMQTLKSQPGNPVKP